MAQFRTKTIYAYKGNFIITKSIFLLSRLKIELDRLKNTLRFVFVSAKPMLHSKRIFLSKRFIWLGLQKNGEKTFPKLGAYKMYFS